MPLATAGVTALEDHEVSLVAHAMATVLQQIWNSCSQATRERHTDVFADALPLAALPATEAVAEPRRGAMAKMLRRQKRRTMATRVHRYFPVLCQEAPRFFQPTQQCFAGFTTGAMSSFESLLLRMGAVSSVEDHQDLDDPALAPKVETLVLNRPEGVPATAAADQQVLGAKDTPDMIDLLDDLEVGQRHD